MSRKTKPNLLKFDSLDVIVYDYQYTDKIIEYIRKKTRKKFLDDIPVLLLLEEAEIYENLKNLYGNVDKDTRRAFGLIANKYVMTSGKSPKDFNSTKWVKGYLKEFNPVTKYVYEHEVDRKTARTYESVMSSIKAGLKESEVPTGIETALRYYTKQAEQYAVDLTDHTVLESFKAKGIKKVRWITMRDNKVCEICEERDGQIYDIDKVPPKPHWNCRCILGGVL